MSVPGQSTYRTGGMRPRNVGASSEARFHEWPKWGAALCAHSIKPFEGRIQNALTSGASREHWLSCNAVVIRQSAQLKNLNLLYHLGELHWFGWTLPFETFYIGGRSCRRGIKPGG